MGNNYSLSLAELLADAPAARVEAITWILRTLRDGPPRDARNLGDGVSTPDGLAASQARLVVANIERLLALGEQACIGGSARIARRKDDR